MNPSLGRADFDRVVTELDAARRCPGVRNLAFTKRVAREGKAAYEESVRNDPFLDPAHRAPFAIRPAGERDEYFVVHYIWSMRSDAEMLGLDISAQPANLASMHFSRDSGRPVPGCRAARPPPCGLEQCVDAGAQVWWCHPGSGIFHPMPGWTAAHGRDCRRAGGGTTTC